MKKIIISVGLIAGMLLMSGCAQPEFNPNNKGFGFIQGKPYVMPKYVVSFEVENEARTVTNLGLCRKNGILWLRRDMVNQIGFLANGSDESALLRRNANTVKQMIRNGSAGCAYPLSNQEYQYVLHKQNQAQANANAKRSYYQQRQTNREIKKMNNYMQNKSFNRIKNGSTVPIFY